MVGQLVYQQEPGEEEGDVHLGGWTNLKHDLKSYPWKGAWIELDESVEQFMSQSTVDNNRAISQWNLALGCGQGKTQSKRTLLKPLSSQVSVHMPKAAASEEPHHTEASHGGVNRLH